MYVASQVGLEGEKVDEVTCDDPEKGVEFLNFDVYVPDYRGKLLRNLPIYSFSVDIE